MSNAEAQRTSADDDVVLWGAASIGREINRSPRQAFHLLNTGAIAAARKVNGLWCAPRGGLRAQFFGAAAESRA